MMEEKRDIDASRKGKNDSSEVPTVSTSLDKGADDEKKKSVKPRISRLFQRGRNFFVTKIEEISFTRWTSPNFPFIRPLTPPHGAGRVISSVGRAADS